MKWLAVDSEPTYGALYRSEDGKWAIHHYVGDKQALGFGHTNCAQLYAVDQLGRERLVCERTGKDALAKAQEAASG